MADQRHFHKDYHTAACGEDASHILMTFDLAEATCKECKRLGKIQVEEKAAAEALHTKHHKEHQAHREKVHKERAEHLAKVRNPPSLPVFKPAWPALKVR